MVEESRIKRHIVEHNEMMPHGVMATHPALPRKFPVRVEGGAANVEPVYIDDATGT